MNKDCMREIKARLVKNKPFIQRMVASGTRVVRSGKGKGKWKGEKNKGKTKASCDQDHHSYDNGQVDSSNKSKEDSFKHKNGDKSNIQCHSCDKLDAPTT
jgi:hypothetical protein